MTQSRIGVVCSVTSSALLVALTLITGGCGGTEAKTVSVPPVAMKVAKGSIEARSGSTVKGEAVFSEAGGKVHVVVTVTGATPGLHAVHVHETGDCSAPDAKSAGSHFNPDGPDHKHGAPDGVEHHAGDFGNMEVGANGTGIIDLTTSSLTVSPGPRSVVGRAIIVHEKVDDFSQPVGNAGARVGCGVINAQ